MPGVSSWGVERGQVDTLRDLPMRHLCERLPASRKACKRNPLIIPDSVRRHPQPGHSGHQEYHPAQFGQKRISALPLMRVTLPARVSSAPYMATPTLTMSALVA